jgi:hypothetical protein
MTMTSTILLSQVFGLYFIIVGAAIVIRRRYFLPVFGAFIEERLTRAIVALIELLAGLFLVVMHNDWSSMPAVIISLLGWITTVEGSAYLLLSDEFVEKMFRALNTTSWYVVSGLLSVLGGLYLAGYGFGFF